MSAYPFQVKNMLRTYGKQITTARRLARYRRMLRAAGAEDEVTISREAKRRDLVQRVTSEIIENLLTTGSDTPIAEELRERLEEDFGVGLIFAYPPEEQDLQIFKSLEDGRVEETTPEEKRVIFERLWQVALEKVDDTML